MKTFSRNAMKSSRDSASSVRTTDFPVTADSHQVPTRNWGRHRVITDNGKGSPGPQPAARVAGAWNSVEVRVTIKQRKEKYELPCGRFAWRHWRDDAAPLQDQEHEHITPFSVTGTFSFRMSFSIALTDRLPFGAPGFHSSRLQSGASAGVDSQRPCRPMLPHRLSGDGGSLHHLLFQGQQPFDPIARAGGGEHGKSRRSPPVASLPANRCQRRIATST